MKSRPNLTTANGPKTRNARKRQVSDSALSDEDRPVTRARVDSGPRRIVTRGMPRTESEQPTSPSHVAGQHKDTADIDYTTLSVPELKELLKPFRITGCGQMHRPELLQLCSLFLTKKTPESATGRRAVNRQQSKDQQPHEQGALAPRSHEAGSHSSHTGDAILGSPRSPLQLSSTSSSPDRVSTLNRKGKKSTCGQGPQRVKNKPVRMIEYTDSEEEPVEKSHSLRLAGSGSHQDTPMVDFPSRERGTALPRPRPTILHPNDKGKQRALTESDDDYDPGQEEDIQMSEDEEMEKLKSDGLSDDRGSSMSKEDSDHLVEEEWKGIDHIIDDPIVSDANSQVSEDDDMMFEPPDNRAMARELKSMKIAQKKTDHNVSQVTIAIREMADEMKKMRAAFSSDRGKASKVAKTPRGGDFLRRIRLHIWTLMGVKKDGRLPPSATERERSRWKRKLPKDFIDTRIDLDDDDHPENGERDPRFPYRGGPGGEDANPQVLLIMWKMMNCVGVRSFRPMWEEKMTSAENKFLWQLAAAIFVRLVQCGEYDDITSSEAKASVVYSALTKHAKQRLQRMYREYTTLSAAEIEARQKHGVRVSRLTVWKNRRIAAATALDGMWPLCAFIKSASSDDETDEEEEFSTETRKRCIVLRMPWRSAALEDLFKRLDAYKDRKAEESPKGVCGAKPRIRIREAVERRKESLLPPPPGLPIDCYCEEWLSSLDATERAGLEIDEEPKLRPLIRQARSLGLTL